MSKIDARTEEGREQIEGGIEWEGFNYYFLDYYPADSFEPWCLTAAVRRFQRAHEELQSALASFGVNV